MLLKVVALYTAIALTGAVCMLVLTHAVTSGALLYIKQEILIVGKLDSISILALSLVFHNISAQNTFDNCMPLSMYVFFYSTITYLGSEILRNTHTHTQRATTVTLATHRGLII